MMNVDGDNFVPPAGFRVIAGPSQVSQSWINGKALLKRPIRTILCPIKGTFVLKGAAIEFNGATYKTAPVKNNSY
jgi:hypothetical protein